VGEAVGALLAAKGAVVLPAEGVAAEGVAAEAAPS
jgi:hypothetical protein